MGFSLKNPYPTTTSKDNSEIYFHPKLTSFVVTNKKILMSSDPNLSNITNNIENQNAQWKFFRMPRTEVLRGFFFGVKMLASRFYLLRVHGKFPPCLFYQTGPQNCSSIGGGHWHYSPKATTVNLTEG
jgi:hypothetical protein